MTPFYDPQIQVGATRKGLKNQLRGLWGFGSSRKERAEEGGGGGGCPYDRERSSEHYLEDFRLVGRFNLPVNSCKTLRLDAVSRCRP